MASGDDPKPEREDPEAILDRPPPPGDHRLAYGPHPLQFGDLRLPPGPGPHPLAIAVHGGFWRAEHGLLHLGHLCAGAAAAGVATWSLEYRRVGHEGGGYPGTLEDVALGAAFARALAARFPLDLARIAVFGHSAGGQLALWLAARPPLPLRAALGLAPVSDLVLGASLRLGAGIIERFLGGAVAEVPERYAEASPRARLPLGVRQVLLHGTADDTVPFAMSERYAAAARAAGDAVELVAFPGAGHFELIDPARPEGGRVVRTLAQLLAPAP